MADKKRTSQIEKNIELCIGLGNFSSIRVGARFGETIEWSSQEERSKKMDSITQNLIEEVGKDSYKAIKLYDLRKRTNVVLKEEGKVIDDDEVEAGMDEVADDEDFDFDL